MKKCILTNFKITLFIILLINFISCKSKVKEQQPEVIKTDTVVTTVQIPEAGRVYDKVTKNNSSYSVYIPSDFTGKEKYPAIIFLDPHGKGNFPLEKYKALADHFHFLLIGSNDSKNGMNIDQSIVFIGDLLNEAVTVLPGNANEISLAGFSGGAKVALAGGNMKTGFSNVIYCGAAFPPASLQVTVPVFGIAGNHDMNYTEVKNFNQSLDKSEIPHSLIEWNGKHEWPDSLTFMHSFYWCLFTSMRNNVTQKNQLLIDDFKKTLDSTIKSEKNLLVKVLLYQEGIDMLNKITSVNDYKLKLNSLYNSMQYKLAKKDQEEILANEDARKSEFPGSFENRELSWWNNQIQSLNAEKNNSSNQRILGYISLAAWTYSSKAVAANNLAFAQKTLDIYKLADPENSEHAFLRACLYSKNGMQDSAMYFLNEAVNLGLDDRSKIENENDLSSLRERADFRDLVGKMK